MIELFVEDLFHFVRFDLSLRDSSTYNSMAHSSDIVFVVLLTAVSIAWVYTFQLYVFKLLDRKTHKAIEQYGPKATTIEGTFVYG